MEEFLMIKKEEFWEKFREVLKEILSNKQDVNKEWLRSKDVREMLNISESTLQTMRITGAIPAHKLGSSWFYKYSEITKALENGKVKGGKNGE